MAYTLDNLETLMVKMVGESGGYGMLVGPHATPAERAAYAEEIRKNPANYVSQPVLDLSVSPCLTEKGAAPRHVDLRPFVLRGRETRLVPGAFCRVALVEGSLVVNSSQGGGGKDLSGCSPTSRMLSRNAQGLYWMGRYLERARHGCRLLSDQLTTMEDRPVEQIEQGWRRLYLAIGRSPLGGHIESMGADEDFMLADAYTLADDLTFEPGNSDGIRTCLAAARENARQVRNTIGNRMWSCLNLAYLGMRDMEIETIWNDQPRAFYLRTEDAIRTFTGIADSGMYRDDAWHFLRLGWFVERTQLVAALVEAHIAIFPTGTPHGESDWRSLLRICEAHFAYRHLYSLEHRPSRIVDFLVADPQLAHSIRRALRQIVDALDAVSDGQLLQIEAGRRVGRMAAGIDHDWPNRDPDDDDATRAALQGIGESCRSLHDDIASTYFDYEIEDAP